MSLFPITRRALWRFRLAWADLRYAMAANAVGDARRRADKAHATLVRIRDQEPRP